MRPGNSTQPGALGEEGVVGAAVPPQSQKLVVGATHLSLQLIDLVLELPDVLGRVRVVQLPLDHALFPLWVEMQHGYDKGWG